MSNTLSTIQEVEIANLLENLQQRFSHFMHNSQKIHNKTAARRARVASLGIEKTLKKYRAISIK